MRVVITGASGFVGRALVPRLRRSGMDLVLVGRDAGALAPMAGAGVRVAGYGDLAEAARGADAIVHLAARNNDRGGDRAAFRAANVDLLRTVLAAAREAGVGLFLNAATLKASDPDARDAYGASKAEAERLLAAEGGLRVVTLRLAAVYDDDAYKGNLAVLYRLPRALRPAARALLACLRPVAHVERVGSAVLGALRAGEGGDAEIVVTDGQGSNHAYRAASRALDLAFALSVIVLLWWLMAGVWAAVRLSSPGPGIFAQTRVGRHGRPFTCYKFRTMHRGTREGGTHEIGAAAVTRVGAFLRRTKLDEFPQAVNVLRGEMSLVGPRPCLPVQEALVEARRRRGVLEARGGITGLAQVRGVDMSDPERLAALDAEYLALRTVPLDARIVLATLLGGGRGDRVRRD